MVVTCPSCQKKNRVPGKDLGSQVRCGACKTDLTPIGEPIEADAETFDDLTQNAPLPVLVDFWAAWCAPCRMVAPEVHATAAAMAGRALVVKVNTEAEPDLAARFDVRGIPNFLVMKQGKVLLQQPGAVRSPQMIRWLEAAATG